MPRKQPAWGAPKPGSHFDAEVKRYLESLGFQNVVIDMPVNSDCTTIDADLAGQHYVASTNAGNSLVSAEKIMTSYWVGLNKDTPFDMPVDGTAQIYKSEIDAIEEIEERHSDQAIDNC